MIQLAIWDIQFDPILRMTYKLTILTASHYVASTFM